MNVDLIGSTSIAHRFHIHTSTAKEWIRTLKEAGDPGVLVTESGRLYLTAAALKRLERKFKRTIALRKV